MPTEYPIRLVGAAKVGSGPTMVYGTPRVAGAVTLSVQSGAMTDRMTGLLGKGIGRVYGTVKRKADPANAPLKRRVRLVRERDGLVMREAWSDAATGEYDFRYIDELQKWTVVAYDHVHDFRAVIADNITPDLLEPLA